MAGALHGGRDGRRRDRRLETDGQQLQPDDVDDHLLQYWDEPVGSERQPDLHRHGSANAIAGTFANAGAADGNLTGFGTYNLGGQEFAISYTADINGNLGAGSFTGGHDIALMAVPEPNSLAMLAGSLGMALGLQRFRRRRS